MRPRLLLLGTLPFLVVGCDGGTGPDSSGEKTIVDGELALIGPEHYALLVGESVSYSALVDCAPECGPPGHREVENVDWSSSDPDVAGVSNGRVTGRRAGSAVITGTVDFVASRNQTDQVTANVTVAESFVPLTGISAGVAISCGTSADGTAYCWGDTTDSDPRTPRLNRFADELFPHALRSLPNVTAVTAGERDALILSGTDVYEWGGGESLRPLIGAPGFRSLTEGGGGGTGTAPRHACGIAVDDETYCWGSNSVGQLGTDSVAFSTPVPVRVDTDLRFASLTAGGAHTCGLTTAGRAYCWGENTWGQLGDASTSSASRPVAVAGGLSFTQLAAGLNHTCGLTAAGVVHCWGANDIGQLGLGIADPDAHPVPELVQAARSFNALGAGGFTCALDELGDPYCWGRDFGSAPTHLPGQLSFRSLSVGSDHACGVPDSGRPRCWGDNGAGQLGAYLGVDTSFTGQPVRLAGPAQE